MELDFGALIWIQDSRVDAKIDLSLGEASCMYACSSQTPGEERKEKQKPFA
jgi:hypothetical protein